MTTLTIILVIVLLLFLWIRRRNQLGKPIPGFGGRQLARLPLDIDGTLRWALVQRAHSKQGRLPLLLCFHGGSGSDPRQFARMSALAATAQAAGFLAAFPAAEEGWSDGRPERGDDPLDFVFVDRLVQYLAQQGHIDPNRVYAIGASSGGMFVQRLSAERPRLLKGGAAVLASVPIAMVETIADGPPLPFALISDRNDMIMPWDGGEILRGPMYGVGGQVLSMEEALAVWQHRNQADYAIAPVHIPGPEGFDAEILDFLPQEDDGAPLRFVAVSGGGHRWPRWPSFRGSTGFDAGRCALDFFARADVNDEPADRRRLNQPTANF